MKPFTLCHLTEEESLAFAAFAADYEAERSTDDVPLEMLIEEVE